MSDSRGQDCRASLPRCRLAPRTCASITRTWSHAERARSWVRCSDLGTALQFLLLNGRVLLLQKDIAYKGREHDSEDNNDSGCPLVNPEVGPA